METFGKGHGMTSVTQRKAYMKKVLREIIMDTYDEVRDGKKRAITSGLVSMVMRKMTLKELKAWHQGITINRTVDEIVQEKTETCHTK